MDTRNSYGVNSTSLNNQIFFGKYNQKPNNKCSATNFEGKKEYNEKENKIYNKGLLHGAIVVALIAIVDYVTDYLIDKKGSEKIEKEIDELFSENKNNIPTKTSKEFHIPIISTIKKLLSSFKK